MTYPTERSRLIASGRIRPIDSRPTLRLTPSERSRFESEAVAGTMRFRPFELGELSLEFLIDPNQEVNGQI